MDIGNCAGINEDIRSFESHDLSLLALVEEALKSKEKVTFNLSLAILESTIEGAVEEGERLHWLIAKVNSVRFESYVLTEGALLKHHFIDLVLNGEEPV